MHDVSCMKQQNMCPFALTSFQTDRTYAHPTFSSGSENRPQNMGVTSSNRSITESQNYSLTPWKYPYKLAQYFLQNLNVNAVLQSQKLHSLFHQFLLFELKGAQLSSTASQHFKEPSPYFKYPLGPRSDAGSIISLLLLSEGSNVAQIAIVTDPNLSRTTTPSFTSPMTAF